MSTKTGDELKQLVESYSNTDSDVIVAKLEQLIARAKIDELKGLFPEGARFTSDYAESLFRTIINERIAQLESNLNQKEGEDV